MRQFVCEEYILLFLMHPQEHRGAHTSEEANNPRDAIIGSWFVFPFAFFFFFFFFQRSTQINFSQSS